MNKYQLLRINYPGLFAIQPSIWLPFKDGNEKYAFMVGNITKGMAIYDPFNEFVEKNGNKYAIKLDISDPRSPSYALSPQGKNMKLFFTSISEEAPTQARTYSEKPYTELFLLLDHQKKEINLDNILPYLQSLFIRYNATFLRSTLIKPDKAFWLESLIALQCSFEHRASFETIINSGFDWNLPFKVASIFIGQAKDGILPPEAKFIKSASDLPEINKKYFDVFDLFSSSIMHLNYFKNYKIALLEAFIAVEILIIRVTDEVQLAEGISKSKISEFKQAIDLAYRMDVLLKLFFDFSKDEETLIGQMVRARKLRNDIMHNNKVTNNEDIAVLIEQVRKFLFMLIEKHESELHVEQ